MDLVGSLSCLLDVLCFGWDSCYLGLTLKSDDCVDHYKNTICFWNSYWSEYENLNGNYSALRLVEALILNGCLSTLELLRVAFC